MRMYFSFGLATMTWRCMTMAPFLSKTVNWVAPGARATNTSVWDVSARILK